MIDTGFFMYNNKVYNIVNYIEIEGIVFAVAGDYENKYTYFKHSKVGDKHAFTPFETLTAVLPQYQTIAVQNMVNFMDALIEMLSEHNNDTDEIFAKANDIITMEKNNFKQDTYQDLSVQYFKDSFIHLLEFYTKKSVDELLFCETKETVVEIKEEPVKKTRSTRSSKTSSSARQVYACIIIILFVCLIQIFSEEGTWNNGDKIMNNLLGGTEISEEYVDSDAKTTSVASIYYNIINNE